MILSEGRKIAICAVAITAGLSLGGRADEPHRVSISAVPAQRSSAGVSIRFRLTNDTSADLVVHLPLICSYHFFALHRSPPEIESDKDTEGYLTERSPSEGGNFQCGPWLGRCNRLTSSVTVTPHNSIDFEEWVPHDAPAVQWLTDDITFVLEIDSNQIACNQLCEKPKSVSVVFREKLSKD